jgi:hypothetical protein
MVTAKLTNGYSIETDSVDFVRVRNDKGQNIFERGMCEVEEDPALVIDAILRIANGE